MKYPNKIYSWVSLEQCLTSCISHGAIFYHVKVQSTGFPMSHEINFWYEVLFRFNLHLPPIKIKNVQNQTMPYLICQNKHVSFQWAIDEQVWKICNNKGLSPKKRPHYETTVGYLATMSGNHVRKFKYGLCARPSTAPYLRFIPASAASIYPSNIHHSKWSIRAIRCNHGGKTDILSAFTYLVLVVCDIGESLYYYELMQSG